MERTPDQERPLNTFWLFEGQLRTVWKLASYASVFLCCALVVGLVIVALPGNVSLNETGHLVTLFAAFAATWFGVVFIDRRKFLAVGLSPNRIWLRQLGIGVALSTSMILLLIAVKGAFGIVDVSVVQPSFEQGILTISRGMLFFIIVSVSEEVLVRGYPLQSLIAGTNERVAVLSTSVLFAALHLANPYMTTLSFTNIVLAGLWLGAARIVSGSLWLPIGLHTGWNFTQGTILGFPVSGVEGRSIFLSIEKGEDWITGGSFGPEGGVLATLVLIAGTAILFHPGLKARLQAAPSDDFPEQRKAST